MIDKNEIIVEKKSICATEFGKYRFQEYEDDKIHIHDDEKNLVFEYYGKRSFQIGIEEFIKTQHKYSVDDKIIIRGERNSRSDVKMADVILFRTNDSWELILEPKDTIKGINCTVLIADKTIAFLSDFIDSF